MTADLRRLIADDAFAASFQTVRQYRDALLAAASQVLPDPEPSLLQLLSGGWGLGGGRIDPETAQLVDGCWWKTTRGNSALQQVVDNARALWRAHNGAAWASTTAAATATTAAATAADVAAVVECTAQLLDLRTAIAASTQPLANDQPPELQANYIVGPTPPGFGPFHSN